jgi:hypothetical protein
MNRVFWYVAGRALGYSLIQSAVCVLIVAGFTATAEGTPDRNAGDQLRVLALIYLGLLCGLTLLNSTGGLIFHLRAVRRLGVPLTVENAATSHSRSVTVKGGVSWNVGRCRQILLDLDGVKSVTKDPATGSLRAVRKAHGGVGYAQVIEVSAAESGTGTQFVVHSRPRFHIATFDLGQNLANVTDIVEQLSTRQP